MTTISYPCPDERRDDDLWSREREIGTLFLPETRRLSGVVTRASQGVLGVETRRSGHIPHDNGQPGATVADSTVALEVNPPTDGGDELELRLLPGEARSLAAMLTRAADEVELHLGPEVADLRAFEWGREAERAGL